MEFKTWFESLKENFEPSVVENLLQEAPHVFGFSGQFPETIEMLRGNAADMGFEDIENKKLKFSLIHAFSDVGLIIPGTKLKIRFVYPNALIEPANGEEEMLPENWKSYLTVFRTVNNEIVFTWIGKNVRKDRFAGINLAEVRNLSEEELDSESWGGNCVCLVLSDGTLIYPSSDGEGNNHGFLFGKKGKKGFVLH